ncbi:hypothetical protein PRVXT_002490 [Proteinivorax tanatarense]|uniref:Uncharacterized protein n=1 Tax=Proteinivorax tanatarense TaxID=1260629 RepID=A0AAU7VK30_9FIRM
MEWIKAIIEKHTKEDGTVDMDKATKEIPLVYHLVGATLLSLNR